MTRIPIAGADKLLRFTGEERISQDAKETLRDLLEEKAAKVAKQAALMAKHARRKTILQSDVDFVLKK